LTTLLPRFGMALLIGVVFSTPLVLQIFNREIRNEITILQQEDKAKFATELAKDPRFVSLPEDEAKVASLQRRVSNVSAVVNTDPNVVVAQKALGVAQAAYDTASQRVICEQDGTCGSGKVGDGPSAHNKAVQRNELKARVAQAEADLQAARVSAQEGATQSLPAWRSELADLSAQVKLREQLKRSEEAQHERTSADSAGLLARIEALDALQKDRPTVKTAHIVLFAFLTLIEVLPVLVKLLQSFGKPSLYEELADEDDDFRRTAEQLRRETELEEARQYAESALSEVEVRTRREVEGARRVARYVVETQVTLAKKLVDQWRADQERQLEVQELERHLVDVPAQLEESGMGDALAPLPAVPEVPEQGAEPPRVIRINGATAG
jgi:hypothetical protein